MSAPCLTVKRAAERTGLMSVRVTIPIVSKVARVPRGD